LNTVAAVIRTLAQPYENEAGVRGGLI